MKNRESRGVLNRRQFCAAAGMAAMAGFVSPGAVAEAGEPLLEDMEVQTGNGEWTYRVVPNWRRLSTPRDSRFFMMFLFRDSRTREAAA